MTARIIDGRLLASRICDDLKIKIATLRDCSIIPSIKVILVGDNPASAIYVRTKKKRAAELGIDLQILNLSVDVQCSELQDVIGNFNRDQDIHAILVQTPLPKHLNTRQVLNFVSPDKDVDCFTDINLGKLFAGDLDLIPCTPKGILQLLKTEIDDLKGMKLLMIGNSIVVGRPMSQVLLHHGCTVFMAHSKTIDLKELCLIANVIIVAAGCPNLVKYAKKDAIIIDVGINQLPNSKIVGDVDFDLVKNQVKAITPVPGGVGPMTVAALMQNTVYLCKKIHNLI